MKVKQGFIPSLTSRARKLSFGKYAQGLRREQMMEEQRCFAHQRGRCIALSVEECRGTGCSFYQTADQLASSRQKAQQYILALAEPRRRQIINAYYGGKIELLREAGERP